MESKNRKIRLIWDFRGPDALETAKHHVIHLKEFAIMENLPFYEAAIQQQNDYLAMAFIIINEKNLMPYKNALKPDRGTIVS
ncbi:MAG TPA: hypothetical protein ENK67_02425 [Flavobacteriia bacterium]|nr:hypothetical protein [Flavobacteriia bacterium]